MSWGFPGIQAAPVLFLPLPPEESRLWATQGGFSYAGSLRAARRRSQKSQGSRFTGATAILPDTVMTALTLGLAVCPAYGDICLHLESCPSDGTLLVQAHASADSRATQPLNPDVRNKGRLGR